MKRLGLLLATVLVLGFILVLIPVPTAKAVLATNATFTTTISDGDMESGVPSYDPTVYMEVRNATIGLVYLGPAMYVGQAKVATDYHVYRSFVFFDTISIPDTANITGAVLSIYVDDYSDTDFNVTIQSGQPTYPHNPLQQDDYYYTRYQSQEGSYSARNTSEIAGSGYWNITIQTADLAWISKTSTTKLALRSSREIAANAPVGSEYVAIYTRDYSPSYAAQLYVNYSVPETPEEGQYTYRFYGPYDEDTGLSIDENVTVGVYSTEGVPYATFILNGEGGYNISTYVQFFQFTFSDNTTREYWIDPRESTAGDIYVFKAASTSYVINFMDTAGYLKTYPYITAKRYINGTLYTVEKRKVDIYGSVIMNLIAGRTYQISLGNEANTYVFGDLTVTGTTAIQLVLRAVDFPTQTILTQRYVRAYAYRNTTAITIIFEDTQSNTASVDIAVYLSDFTSIYNTTQTAQSFTVEWTSASASLTYQVTVTIHHNTYGDLTYKNILPRTISTTAPFSLDFLGQWSFNSAFLLPAFIILFTAGCFSALNAEVGAILTCIVAIILTWMGWIPIPAGAIVAATTFSILLALVVHKRGG